MPKEAPKPTHEDAKVLLELLEATQTDNFQKARNWWFGNLSVENPMPYEEFKQKFPEGSEGHNSFGLVSSFFETAGVLVKYGLLHEDLFFDRFLIDPYWKSAKTIVRGERSEYDPLIAENFEWLARRAPVWRRKHLAKKKRR